MQGCLPTTAVGQLICECWFFQRDRHISHWIISIIMIVWISNIWNGKIEPHFTLHRYHKLNSDRALAEWLWPNVIRIPSNNQWISQPSILETDPVPFHNTTWGLTISWCLISICSHVDVGGIDSRLNSAEKSSVHRAAMEKSWDQ